MRHGIAVESDEWDGDDASRPLTPQGEKKTRKAARGLRVLSPSVDLIASSPLLRAQQTAETVQRELHNVPLAIWAELESAEYSALRQRLQTLQVETVVLVGHEPGLSRLASQLLTGKAASCQFDFKKAAVCAIEVDWRSSTPRGVLQFFAPSTILRPLSKK
jgi:phosphohistidine phosphatase